MEKWRRGGGLLAAFDSDAGRHFVITRVTR